MLAKYTKITHFCDVRSKSVAKVLWMMTKWKMGIDNKYLYCTTENLLSFVEIPVNEILVLFFTFTNTFMNSGTV